MRVPATFFAAVLTVLCAFAAPPAAAAKPKAPGEATRAYDEAIAAYRAGEFEKALKGFQEAERRGLDTPNLQLNLGLTYYRLGRYEESRQRFESLRSDLRYTALAEYHLGLIAARLGERDSAAQHFESVQYMTANNRLRNMALVAMLRMDNLGLDYDPFTTAAAAPRPDFYARVATGFDSNPELIADVLDQETAGKGVSYTDLRGDINLPLLATGAGETFLRADVQVREYGSERGFDQYAGELELRQAFTVTDWRIGIAAEGGNTWLDGEAYEGVAGGGMDFRREFPSVALTVRADSVRVNGEGAFDYLDGRRHRLGVELGRGFNVLRARANYEYEHNERIDFADGPEFSSYSPRRHAVGAAFAVPLGARVSLESRFRYRDSHYPDPNRFFVNGTLVEQTRDDQLLTVGVRGRLRAGRTWNWLGDIQYNRNNSSIGEFDYTRHLLLIGLEWLR